MLVSNYPHIYMFVTNGQPSLLHIIRASLSVNCLFGETAHHCITGTGKFVNVDFRAFSSSAHHSAHILWRTSAPRNSGDGQSSLHYLRTCILLRLVDADQLVIPTVMPAITNVAEPRYRYLSSSDSRSRYRNVGVDGRTFWRTRPNCMRVSIRKVTAILTQGGTEIPVNFCAASVSGPSTKGSRTEPRWAS